MLHSIILGIVQGITEFLPISSSGHLVIFRWFLGWEEHPLLFDVVLHAGSLCAILIYFRNDWFALFRGAFSGERKAAGDNRNKLLFFLIAASAPAVIVGSLIAKDAEAYFRNPIGISVFLGLFGVLLYLAEAYGKKDRSLSEMTWRLCLFIGLAQALALIPGVSRSGVTITAALAMGMSRESSVRFSFLLGAPIIFAALCYHLIELFSVGSAVPTQYLLTGFLAAFLSSISAIYFLLKFIKNHPFTIFAVYRLFIALAIAISFMCYKG